MAAGRRHIFTTYSHYDYAVNPEKFESEFESEMRDPIYKLGLPFFLSTKHKERHATPRHRTKYGTAGPTPIQHSTPHIKRLVRPTAACKVGIYFNSKYPQITTLKSLLVDTSLRDPLIILCSSRPHFESHSRGSRSQE
jgi:hypothetical protein